MLDRIKQYIDIKHISVSAFEKSIGMSNASFGKSFKNGGTIGADKLEIILNVYPDININWLVLNIGPMLISEIKDNVIRPPTGDKCGNCAVLESTIADLRASLADKNKIIAMLESKASNQDNSEQLGKTG